MSMVTIAREKRGGSEPLLIYRQDARKKKDKDVEQKKGCKKMKRTRNRIISVLVAAMMVAMLLPAAAFAADGEDGALDGGFYWNGTESVAFTTTDLVLEDEADADEVKMTLDDSPAADELIDATAPYPIAIPFGTTLAVGTLVETADTAAAATAAAPFSILDSSTGAYGVVIPKAEIANAALNLVTGAKAGNAVDFAANVTAAIGDYIVIVDGTSPDATTDAAGATLNYAVFAVQQSTGGQLIGDGSLKTPVYNVVAPTTLAYAINPLALGVDPNVDAEGTQISSPAPYIFANGTDETPVRVTVNLTATVDSSASLQDGETFTPVGTGNSDKHFSLGVVGATTVTGTPSYSDPDGDGATFKQSSLPANTSTIRYFDADTKAVAIDFLLAPGDANETLNAKEELGVGLFKLYGQLNTYPQVAWQKNDITIAGTYTLGGIKATDYVEPFAADTADDDSIADDPATNVVESGTADENQNDYDAWRGGLKGSTSREDATEVIGVNVWPLANPTPPPVQNGETAETPYILTAGVPKVVVFHTPQEERGSVYLKLDGADPDLTPIFGVNNQMPSGANTSSGIFLQMVRPDQSVAVQTAADFSFEDGILHFTPSVAPGSAGARTLNIVTPTATYRVDYSSDYVAP